MCVPRSFLAAALALGVGGFCLAPQVRADDDNRTAGQKAEDAMQRAGDKVENAADRAGDALRRTGDRISDAASTQPSANAAGQNTAKDSEDIRETLKEVTQAAATKGGFDDLVERFVDADRNRLGKSGMTEQDQPTLDGRIAQLQKDWKAKYNQDFKIGDKEAVYNSSFASISEGEIPGTPRLAGERQGASSDTNGTGAGVSGDINRSGASGSVHVGDAGVSGSVNADRNGATGSATAGDVDRNRTAATPSGDQIAGGDTNREPGRNVATVTINASHGLPELTVPMIHEFPDRWKIDVPDNYSSQQLRDNLLKHLTMFNEQKDQWPSDPNEAYRMATHHVLMAVMNIDAQGQGGAMNSGQPSGSGMQPQNSSNSNGSMNR